jgi:hypothetical protein
MPELERNHLLRNARLRLPSASAPGDHASRAEVADAVNAWLWRETGKRQCLDAHYIAKMERGVLPWPNAAYRSGLRHVLGANSDAELGFRAPRRSAAVSTPSDPSHWGPTVVERAIVITDDDLMAASRRTLLGQAAALAGAALVAELEPFLRPAAFASRRGHAFDPAEVDAAERLVGALRQWHSTQTPLARRAVVAQLKRAPRAAA